MAIDLSKFSDEDLKALQTGDISKVSTAGLTYLQQNQSSDQQAAPQDNGSGEDDYKVLGMGTGVSPNQVGAAGAGASEALLNIPTYLAAAGDVAGDAISGNKTAKSWLDYKRQRQAVNKQQSEAHPYAHAAGAIGASLAAAPFLPELGIAEGIGATSALGKVGAAAAEGILPGMAYGASGSEANPLTDTKEFAKDVASGGLMGAGTGGALNAVGQVGKAALSKAGDIANNSDYIQKLKQLYSLGKDKNVNLSSTVGKDISAAMVESESGGVKDTIMPIIGRLGNNVKQSLVDADKMGATVNIDDQLLGSAQNLFGQVMQNPDLHPVLDDNSKRVMNMLFAPETTGTTIGLGGKKLGSLSPLEARDVKDTFYGLAEKLEGVNTPLSNAVRNEAMGLGKSINETLKVQVPEYAKAAQQYNQFLTYVPETILNKKLPIDLQTKSFGDLGADRETALYSGTRDMLEKSQLPGANVTGGPRATLVKLKQNLETLKMTDPKSYEEMGGDNAFQNLRDKANLLAGTAQAQGKNPSEGAVRSFTGTLVGSGEGLGLNLANKAGSLSSSVGQTAPVKLGSKLFNAGSDSLMGVAQKMQENDATKRLGSALETALNNKTDVAKNAVLFSMLQDPAYRSMLKNFGYDSGESK